MELIDHVAVYISSLLPATSGIMPPDPDRCATVYATGVRSRRDEEGSRFQIVVRSEKEMDTALADAMDIVDLLDDFSGILTVDSPYISRIALESGAASLGADENRRILYSINFRAWVC